MAELCLRLKSEAELCYFFDEKGKNYVDLELNDEEKKNSYKIKNLGYNKNKVEDWGISYLIPMVLNYQAVPHHSNNRTRIIIFM